MSVAGLSGPVPVASVPGCSLPRPAEARTQTPPQSPPATARTHRNLATVIQVAENKPATLGLVLPRMRAGALPSTPCAALAAPALLLRKSVCVLVWRSRLLPASLRTLCAAAAARAGCTTCLYLDVSVLLIALHAQLSLLRSQPPCSPYSSCCACAEGRVCEWHSALHGHAHLRERDFPLCGSQVLFLIVVHHRAKNRLVLMTQGWGAEKLCARGTAAFLPRPWPISHHLIVLPAAVGRRCYPYGMQAVCESVGSRRGLGRVGAHGK